MDFIWVDVGAIKSEPEAIPQEQTQISQCDAILQHGIIKQEIGDTSTVKCEPGTIPEAGSPTSHCDSKLQYGIVKQEIEDASVIKCESAAEEHTKSFGAHFEMNIDSSDIKKECFVHLERIDQCQGKPFIISSGAISRLNFVYLRSRRNCTHSSLISFDSMGYFLNI